MKKTIALAIALIMALTLAACGGNNDTPSGGNTPPPTSNTPSETPEPTPPESPQPSETPTPDSGGIDIPDNGTPPDAPPPFETHLGDKGYFYTTTDDWMIIMVLMSAEVANSWLFQGEYSTEYSVLMLYNLIDWGGKDFEKLVHESNAHAEAYAARADGGEPTIVVDNVTYREIHLMDSHPDTEKMNNIQERHHAVTQFGGHLYLSMPEGYEEFVGEFPVPVSGTGASGSNATPSGNIEFGGYDWLVLDVQGSEALIISEYILETRAYHTENTAITWENSDIRAYLNGEFLGSFSEADKARIVEKTIINDGDSMYGTDGGNSTMDKIFLLSTDEVQRYFNYSGLQAFDKNGEAGRWWLRTSTFDLLGDNYVPSINAEGSLTDGMAVNYIGGVRPMMWITLP